MKSIILYVFLVATVDIYSMETIDSKEHSLSPIAKMLVHSAMQQTSNEPNNNNTTLPEIIQNYTQLYYTLKDSFLNSYVNRYTCVEYRTNHELLKIELLLTDSPDNNDSFNNTFLAHIERIEQLHGYTIHTMNLLDPEHNQEKMHYVKLEKKDTGEPAIYIKATLNNKLGLKQLARPYIPHKRPLSDIEKQLVLYKIARDGLESVDTDIKTVPKCGYTEHGKYKYSKYGPYFCRKSYQIYPTLRIQAVFNQNEIPTNALAKTLFNRIEEIENQYGYQPHTIDTYTLLDPACALGERTSYQWFEQDNTRLPCVYIDAQLINKKELLNFAKKHRNKATKYN